MSTVITARHKLTGRMGEIQATKGTEVYFQADEVCGLQGWFPSRNFDVISVTVSDS